MSVKRKIQDINIERILLNTRYVLLYGPIEAATSNIACSKLLALDAINTHPITMLINSPGGSIPDGLAIIDVMKSIQSPVYTVVMGEACSMAGIISVCGDKRFITPNALWMLHDITVYECDYLSKVKARAEAWKMDEDIIQTIFKKHTKLSDEEIAKGMHGELWLDANGCIKKGIADRILKTL